MLLTIPVIALLTAAPNAPVKYPGIDPLLDKVGERFEQQVQDSMKGLHTVRVHKEELDGDGKVKDVEDQLLESVGEGDSREFRVISAIENGKDITAEQKAKQDAFRREHPKGTEPQEHHHGEIDLTKINPFAKSVRNQYLFWVVGPLPAPGAPVHLHFKPWEESKERFVGDAYVDPATGAIRDLSVTPSDLPPFVRQLAIHAKLGGAAADTRATDVDMDAGGGFLFWHKHFRVHMTLGYAPADKT